MIYRKSFQLLNTYCTATQIDCLRLQADDMTQLLLHCSFTQLRHHLINRLVWFSRSSRQQMHFQSYSAAGSLVLHAPVYDCNHACGAEADCELCRWLTRLHYCAADPSHEGKPEQWGEHEVDHILFIQVLMQPRTSFAWRDLGRRKCTFYVYTLSFENTKIQDIMFLLECLACCPNPI